MVEDLRLELSRAPLSGATTRGYKSRLRTRAVLEFENISNWCGRQESNLHAPLAGSAPAFKAGAAANYATSANLAEGRRIERPSFRTP